MSLLVQVVLAPLIVGLHVWSEQIALFVDKSADRGIVGQLQGFLQFAPLDLDNRLATPLVGPEKEAGEYLFGRVVTIMRLPVELLGEVEGVGLDGADAVVVEHVETAELLCRLAWQDVQGTGRQVEAGQ